MHCQVQEGRFGPNHSCVVHWCLSINRCQFLQAGAGSIRSFYMVRFLRAFFARRARCVNMTFNGWQGRGTTNGWRSSTYDALYCLQQHGTDATTQLASDVAPHAFCWAVEWVPCCCCCGFGVDFLQQGDIPDSPPCCLLCWRSSLLLLVVIARQVCI
jgi:hypothetical protein